MERLLNEADNSQTFVRMLTTQYRMNRLIMCWSSEHFYDGKLEPDSSVADHLLSHLGYVSETADTSLPLLLIDTAGCDLSELNTPENMSKGNPAEADIVTHHCELLVKAGVKQSDIAVISAYNLQVDMIRTRLSDSYPGIEVKSVDGFQGREKEAVVISLVRSNDNGEVGFLSETRRINVAITRARRHLCVVCDSVLVSHDEHLKHFIGYMEEHAEVRSAREYDDVIGGVRPEDEVASDVIALSDHKKKVNKKKSDKKMKDVPSSTAPSINKSPSMSVETSKRSELKERLIDFLNSSKDVISFESSLAPRDRAMLHGLAEELGLGHRSDGVGADRHIVIHIIEAAEKPDADKTTDDEDAKILSSSDENSAELFQRVLEESHPPVKKDDSSRCSHCKKYIPIQNVQLHSLHCSKRKATTSSVTTTATPDEDFDSLLAEAQKLNSICNFAKCKHGVVTLGSNCQFCKCRFCLTHALPEVHGCGEAVRRHARQTLVKEGRLHPGSGVPSKKPSAQKRAALERRLDKKLTDLSGARKKKGGNK